MQPPITLCPSSQSISLFLTTLMRLPDPHQWLQISNAPPATTSEVLIHSPASSPHSFFSPFLLTGNREQEKTYIFLRIGSTCRSVKVFVWLVGGWFLQQLVLKNLALMLLLSPTPLRPTHSLGHRGHFLLFLEKLKVIRVWTLNLPYLFLPNAFSSILTPFSSAPKEEMSS